MAQTNHNKNFPFLQEFYIICNKNNQKFPKHFLNRRTLHFHQKISRIPFVFFQVSHNVYRIILFLVKFFL